MGALLILLRTFMQLGFIVALISAFVPAVSSDVIWGVMRYVLVTPASFVFEIFGGFAETLLSNADGNPLEIGIKLLLWMFCIVIALGVPLLYWIFWIFMCFICLPGAIQQAIADSDNPEYEGIGQIIHGTASVDDTFAAELQASAIVAELKKSNK